MIKSQNIAKQKLAAAIDSKVEFLEQQAQSSALDRDIIDVSLPGRAIQHGTLHPISRSVRRITTIFRRLGFDVADGPEIEDDFHNFGALNIPEDHPARAMHDTFYLSPGVVLRTHTSPVQVRYMENQELPIRVIAPGKVYRCDSDVTHTPMFNQVEGLAVDVDITFSDLKGILIHFVREFFEQDLPVRFRPSYFPFTEPSAEVDIWSEKRGQWLEIMGSGMVDPEVFRSVKIDSEVWNGYAFGMGVERICMLKYDIDDIRLLYQGDLRFLEQF